MDKDNPAFTGFFNNGHKRIDLVLVIESQTIVYYGVKSETIEDRIINYLTRIIKFGLELELEEGKMFEHRNLMFVKIHAPDPIIEEYGIYFNVRKFFKDTHVDNIHPFWNPFGMKDERESIKLIREQYPGPGNYSTLERSRIVYNIINRLPFRFGNEELSGINRLIDSEIILDAYALHDGPYFLTPGQKTCFNARQSLFYNWLGIRNIWRKQPIHMIQEYLGDRVAIYFAYYEYFNIMLLFPAIVGLLFTLTNYYGEQPKLDIMANIVCVNDRLIKKWIICPQCRHFDLCPSKPMVTYCKELKFISNIDTPYMRKFAFFVSIWGVTFATLWKRKQNYLTWIWEIKENLFEKVCNSKKVCPPQLYRSHLTGAMLEKFNFRATCKRSFQVLLSVTLFGVWLFGLFILSTQIWYVKHWLDKIYNKEYNPDMDFTNRYYSEQLFIGIGAGIYSIVTTPLKVVTKMLSYKLTTLENETVGSYSCSLALKLYGFYFTGTFALLTFHIFVGNVFYTHLLDMNNWYSISGFKVMNNGLGTSLDDMCITLFVAVVIEQIIVKVPLYMKRKTADYQGVFNKNAPIWEKEYKLDSLKDGYFHNEYNDIAIQFAMATLFSLTFPLAPFLILFNNLWEIRHKARNLLLGYRRPLLLNTSGPFIWNNIIVFTSYLIPLLNILIIALQSRYFLVSSAYQVVMFNLHQSERRSNLFSLYFNYTVVWETFADNPDTKQEMHKHLKYFERCSYSVFDYYWLHGAGDKFYPEYPTLHVYLFKYWFIVQYFIIGVFIIKLIFYIIPTKSNDIEDAQNAEWRIKQKFYIRKGFLINDESDEPC